MEIGLIQDEEIALLLSTFIPINDICKYIIDLKNTIERKETLSYHTGNWETIASKYFRSIEKEGRPYSYVSDGKDYISEKDRWLEFYNETGISYQVRALLLDILNCQVEVNCWLEVYSENILNCTRYEWRKEDDDLYSVLSTKIMHQFHK